MAYSIEKQSATSQESHCEASPRKITHTSAVFTVIISFGYGDRTKRDKRLTIRNARIPIMSIRKNVTNYIFYKIIFYRWVNFFISTSSLFQGPLMIFHCQTCLLVNCNFEHLIICIVFHCLFVFEQR